MLKKTWAKPVGMYQTHLPLPVYCDNGERHPPFGNKEIKILKETSVKKGSCNLIRMFE